MLSRHVLHDVRSPHCRYRLQGISSSAHMHTGICSASTWPACAYQVISRSHTATCTHSSCNSSISCAVLVGTGAILLQRSQAAACGMAGASQSCGWVPNVPSPPVRCDICCHDSCPHPCHSSGNLPPAASCFDIVYAVPSPCLPCIGSANAVSLTLGTYMQTRSLRFHNRAPLPALGYQHSRSAPQAVPMAAWHIASSAQVCTLPRALDWQCA